jgi:acetyl esterase/lipase
MHKYLSLIVLTLLLASPHPLRAEIKTDITYATPDGQPLKLDAGIPDFSPTSPPAPFPAILLVHGGGWSSGDKAADFPQLYAPLNNAGIAWFSINYRLAPQHRWPACLDDVNSALHWLHDHAAAYHCDPTRLAILGYSAGGHLAFCAALHTDPPPVPLRAIVGLAPPTDLELDLSTRGGLSPSLQSLLNRPHELTPDSQKLLHDISPLHYLHENLPPILILHGTADKSVPYPGSLNFQKADQSLRNSCDLITLKDAPHRIADWPKYDPTYAQQLADWLHKTLYTPATAATESSIQPR